MQIEFQFNKQAFEEDKESFQKFFQAIQLMLNRMAVSHFKYGNMGDKYPDNAIAAESAEQRLQRYRSSGNTEELVDAANFLLIEFVHPYHEKAHFRAQGSEHSPGIVYRG